MFHPTRPSTGSAPARPTKSTKKKTKKSPSTARRKKVDEKRDKSPSDKRDKAGTVSTLPHKSAISPRSSGSYDSNIRTGSLIELRAANTVFSSSQRISELSRLSYEECIYHLENRELSYTQWLQLPPLRVRPMSKPGKFVQVSGLEDDTAEHGKETYLGYASCESCSNYPRKEDGSHLGDPIADQFGLRLHENQAVVILADGCGWGTAAREAARRAVRAHLDYSAKQKGAQDLRQAGRWLLRSLQEAHTKIIEGHKDMFAAGTTTVVAGVLLELDVIDKPAACWDVPRVFLCASVGDCKAYVYVAKDHKVREITFHDSGELRDAKDPGGRLGPHLADGSPDLRNLSLHLYPVNKGDILILVSDGVHDNLDPESRGLLPNDPSVGLEVEEWAKLDPRTSVRVRRKHAEQTLTDMFAHLERVTPSSISSLLLQHARTTCASSVTFMEENPALRLPDDLKRYPGKMDHVTCLCLCVDDYDFSFGRHLVRDGASQHSTADPIDEEYQLEEESHDQEGDISQEEHSGCTIGMSRIKRSPDGKGDGEAT